MAIYLWFTFWLFLIIFTGIGVYSLASRLAKPAIVNWILLPGTIISEMAYIFGCLITGGEIRRAKILPEGKEGGGEATTESQPRLKTVGPVLASLIAIILCAVALLAAWSTLGEGVISQFTDTKSKVYQPLTPMNWPDKKMPDSAGGAWNVAWQQVDNQVAMLKHVCETLGELTWRDWHVGLFVYLSACLGIRLSPARRPLRPTLAAGVLIAGGIAIVGAIWRQFDNTMERIWPLLTYTWATLLFLVVAMLVISAVVALMEALAGKTGKGG